MVTTSSYVPLHTWRADSVLSAGVGVAQIVLGELSAAHVRVAGPAYGNENKVKMM